MKAGNDSYVSPTEDFARDNRVWVSDDESPGEFATVETIVEDEYLVMTAALDFNYAFDQNAKVCLIHVISNDIVDVDTWRDRVTTIGRCKLRLDNRDDNWGDHFVSNDFIVISINDIIVWVGLLDDVKPYLPVKGVISNEMIITGRDYGRYLVDYSFTAKYATGWAADIVDLILADLDYPLLYTDDEEYEGEVQIKYEGIRVTLGDALRE
ncbi:unnamed protein product, partial [marine sediment metagenome]